MPGFAPGTSINFHTLRDAEIWARTFSIKGVGNAAGDVSGPLSALAIGPNKVTTAMLAATIQQLIKGFVMTNDGPKAATTNITFTIQVQDVVGNNLAGYFLMRVWIGTADKGAPAAGLTFGSLTSGTQIQQVTANEDYWFETDSTGKIVFTGTAASSGSLYIMGALASSVKSSTGVWT